MIRRWVKQHFGLYDLEDLVVGGHCGCCGTWMVGEILPRYWPWGLCRKCVSGDFDG